MKKYYFGFVTAVFLMMSCGKGSYSFNYKELDRYAKESRVPGYEAFIVTTNGDTIVGKKVKRERKKIVLDDRNYKISGVKAFQDKDQFRFAHMGTYAARLKLGKISVFSYTEKSGTQMVTNRATGITSTEATYTTTFIFQKGNGGYEFITSLNLKKAVEDNPEALAKFNELYHKVNNVISNDYKTLMQLVSVYNK